MPQRNLRLRSGLPAVHSLTRLARDFSSAHAAMETENRQACRQRAARPDTVPAEMQIIAATVPDVKTIKPTESSGASWHRGFFFSQSLSPGSCAWPLHLPIACCLLPVGLSSRQPASGVHTPIARGPARSGHQASAERVLELAQPSRLVRNPVRLSQSLAARTIGVSVKNNAEFLRQQDYSSSSCALFTLSS